MGLFDRWFGKTGFGATVRDGMYVIRDPAVAAHIARPTQPNFATEGAPPCAKCGSPMGEYLLTTGGPLGDPAVWDEHPIAVDAWACVRCAAVVELLCGEIDEATRCLDRSDAIDPNDPIARAVRKRLSDVIAGRRSAPRTLRELES